MVNNIKPLSNNVLFQFEDDVRDGMFFDVEKSGIIIGKSCDGSAKQPRWGKVLAVGPDVDTNDVNVGQRILIDALRWTEAYTINERKYWFTRVTEILCVEDQ